ncbi:MAG TPA: multicopper oxidase [Terracidiphilus sp.]|nr:multicopper oxidase [Terracidiphilus sp.]
MHTTTRREFLKRCLASAPALALGEGIACAQGGPAGKIYRTPSTIDRYIDPLPILRRIAPQEMRGGEAQYRVRMMEFARPLHSQLPPTKLWGFEGQYPGPTFDVARGHPIRVQWENRLPEKHIFAVDPHIHGAMPPAPEVRTVPHLHGARTESSSDGLPEKWFTAGHSVLYHYPNSQQAATLWYHDHALGITRLNVYAGLSGFYLLRDQQERTLSLPDGESEIPLVLQDRTLDEEGNLVYAPSMEDGVPLPPGVWGPEFFGNLPVVNGAIYPYLDVEPRAYRLRVLNSANSRFFNLYLNLARRPTDIPALVPMQQIGTDGGLLPRPVKLNKLFLGPAERADLVVDFSAYEGRTVTLSNDAMAPFPGWGMLRMLHQPLYELMQFRVAARASGHRVSYSIPQTLGSNLPQGRDAVRTRDFILSERVDAQGRSLGVRINEKGYDDPVTEVVTLGSTERWRFLNTTDDAHPMHLHLVQFQIVERQGYEPVALAAGKVALIGTPRPPAPNEAGWKDTAVVNPRDVLTIEVRFEGYAGRYVFHCHMLEHEDNDMMRPYEVVAAQP